jgi:hypothetical protein
LGFGLVGGEEVGEETRSAHRVVDQEVAMAQAVVPQVDSQ